MRAHEIDEENTPHDLPEKHGGHAVRRARRAKGGSTPVHVFPKDSPEAEEAEDEKEEFKHGGRKRKAGGHAEGMPAHMRPDRASRSRRAVGGAVALKRGGHAEHETKREERREEERKEHEREERKHGGHAAHHSGEGDIHLHRRRGGEAEREHRATGGTVGLRRGGRASGGHSPFSEGHKGPPRDDNASPAARGYESVRASDPDD